MKPNDDISAMLDWAEDLLDKDHFLKIKMTGFSMFPTLRAGDCGIVEKRSPDEIKPGDIIVYRRANKYIAHRLIRKRKGMLMARGDFNRYADNPVSEDALVGIIRTYEREGERRQVNSLLGKVALYFPDLYRFVGRNVLRVSGFRTKVASLSDNLNIALSGSGKLFLLNAAISFLQGILPFVLIILLKYLTDLLSAGNAQSVGSEKIVWFLIAIALIFTANGIMSELRTYFAEQMSQSVTRNIYNRLHKKHTELDLSCYENPELQNQIHRAVQEASFRPLKIINELLTLVRSVAAALLLVGIFASIKWYLVALLVLAVVPDLLIRIRYSRKFYKLKKEQSAGEREMYYHNRVLTGLTFAKEQKLFGFSAFFQRRFNTLQEKLHGERMHLRKSELRWVIVSQLFAALLIFGALGLVLYLNIHGKISVGTVVLFLFAFQRGYSVLNDLFRSFTRVAEDNTFLNDFVGFLNMQPAVHPVNAAVEAFSLQRDIRIENLSFSYDTSHREALTNINLTIPAGKTLALVGSNGSGKTTLIKLLCGFYQPQKGRILFDGKDVGLIGGELLRRNISAVFQDFALYNVSAKHNIGLGKGHETPDELKVREAAVASGIAPTLEKLRQGYDTLLGNLFSGGEELSIGQWQKMAIARAYYRDAPLLLLDEPSSALDVESEKQIIETLRQLSRNKTAVIVSHRMSTVEWVDCICLLEEGKVVEVGSHHELMQRNGRYAELYRLSGKR
jgi:ATP-binding cassette subfamily B protein